MQNRLDQSSGIQPLGNSQGHKLFQVTAGEYTGRLVALMRTSGSELKLSRADAPYTSWSTPQTVISDASDSPYDGVIESGGDIHVVYSESGTSYLVTRRLAFSGGDWTAGAKVTAYNGASGLDPIISLEPSGTLWVSYARFSSPNRTIYVKSSTDGGASWGSGAADAGTALSDPSVNLAAKLLIGLNDVIVVYSIDLQKIAMRTRPLSGGDWSNEFVIASSSSVTKQFDAAVRSDGLLALVYEAEGLQYREYDGNIWTPAEQIEPSVVLSPNLFFRGNVPVVAYLSLFQGAQQLLKQSMRKAGGFTPPVILDIRAMVFDSVLLFNVAAGSYQEKTDEAAGSGTADLYHSGSGCLVKESGDQILVGMNAPFRYLHFLLSSPGVGGTVAYAYWNGDQWMEFTPSGGLSHLDSATERIALWEDYTGIPANWQKCQVNSESRFWIRIEVASSYSTGPVGSQASAISELSALVARR